ncbi:hypothetical protein CPT_Sansa8 [Caulobacter phage Sansa]|uniref:Terminase small subunit n=1 Tax=Caulobacter phage Sansa TaxID=1675600 RepID=A0A0K1LLN7_9CAUD|nr:hypothetical protein HOR07_gp008 [Caulobacter phage Sansa]AKU43412.1 hypothetical protein CPT_Sansa8 [Caulobacter phage Sansa]
MARDAVQGAGEAEVPTGRAVVAARLEVGPNGLITRGKAERLVQLMAEGMSDTEARGPAGFKSDGADTKQRRGIVASPVFQARLAMLSEEREKLQDRGPLGDALWAAKQTFRAAQLKDDLTTQMRAAQLIADISKNMQGGGDGEPGADGPAAPGAPAGRGPGRPASELKSTKVNIEKITRDLKEIGLQPRTIPAGATLPAKEEDPL